MVKDLITGLVYTDIGGEFSEKSPLICVPYDLSQEILTQVRKRLIPLSRDEITAIPESLIIEFPSVELKAIVRFIRWEDPRQPEGIGRAFITLLFKEGDDIIFYKYKDDIDRIFNEIQKKLVEVSKIDPNNINAELKAFNSKLITLFETLRVKEMQREKETQPSDVKPEEIYIKKIVVAGDASVGKTSLILRFTDRAFSRHYIPTLGVNICEKLVFIGKDIVRMMLWDLAGQEKFEQFRRNSYAGSEATIFVFDLTNPKSFQNLEKWYKEAKKNQKTPSKIVGIILGNKSDLTKDRKVKKEDIDVFSKKYNLNYYETSALTGDNVETAFLTLAQALTEV